MHRSGAFAKNRPNSKSRRVPLARRKRPRQKIARMKTLPRTQEGRALSHPAFPLARKQTRYPSALSMSATMHSTAPQPEQPWQLPHPLRGLSLSPQWSWQSHRPRVAMRRTASTASTATTSATTIVDGVQTKPIISAPPFLRIDSGDAPESASPKVTLSRLYADSFSVSSLRATFSSFLS